MPGMFFLSRSDASRQAMNSHHSRPPLVKFQEKFESRLFMSGLCRLARQIIKQPKQIVNVQEMGPKVQYGQTQKEFSVDQR